MGRRLVRMSEGPKRLGIGKTKFREDYIDTERLRLVPLGERAVRLVEDELDAVVDEVIAARDARVTEAT